jgi:hypothetical protein
MELAPEPGAGIGELLPDPPEPEPEPEPVPVPFPPPLVPVELGVKTLDNGSAH